MGNESESLREGCEELEWRVVAARSGAETLWLGNRAVHSLYDPERDAEARAAEIAREVEHQGAGFAVLIGPGLDYLPNALLRCLAVPLLVWDPFPQASARYQPDESAWRGGAGYATSCNEVRQALAEIVSRDAPPWVGIHAGYEEIARFEHRWLERELRRVYGISPALSPKKTLVSQRGIDSLVRFPFLGSVDELDGFMDDQTAILVGPGPSLYPALDALASRTGGMLMASLRALRPLYEAGVRVDLAVNADPLDPTKTLRGIGNAGDGVGAFLAESATAPVLLDRWPRKTFLFHFRSPHLPQLAWQRCRLPYFDEPFVSVSEASLQLAYGMGARRFVLIGMDFCGATSRYVGRFRAPRISGAISNTSPHYFHAARYLNDLCPRMRSEGCSILRTGDGLSVAGADSISVEQLAPHLAGPPARAPSRPEDRISDRFKVARDLIAAGMKPRWGGDLERAPLHDSHWSQREAELRPIPRADRRKSAARALRALREARRG